MNRRAAAIRARGVLAGIVRLQEALDDGDHGYAHGILEALELDLRELAYQLEEPDTLEDAA